MVSVRISPIGLIRPNGLESSRHFPSAVALKIAENADGTRRVPATLKRNQVAVRNLTEPLLRLALGWHKSDRRLERQEVCR